MRRLGAMSGDLLLAGLRARARLYAGLFVCAVLVIGAAVTGQVFATAAQESIARDTLSTADAGLRLRAEISPFDATFPPSSLAQILPQAPAAGALAGFPGRTTTTTVASDVRAAAHAAQPSHLIWREGFCRRLRIIDGRCPTRSGEALISQSTAIGGNGWAVGATVRPAAHHWRPAFRTGCAPRPSASGSLSSGLRGSGVRRLASRRLRRPGWLRPVM